MAQKDIDARKKARKESVAASGAKTPAEKKLARQKFYVNTRMAELAAKGITGDRKALRQKFQSGDVKRAGFAAPKKKATSTATSTTGTGSGTTTGTGSGTTGTGTSKGSGGKYGRSSGFKGSGTSASASTSTSTQTSNKKKGGINPDLVAAGIGTAAAIGLGAVAKRTLGGRAVSVLSAANKVKGVSTALKFLNKPRLFVPKKPINPNPLSAPSTIKASTVKTLTGGGRTSNVGGKPGGGPRTSVSTSATTPKTVKMNPENAGAPGADLAAIIARTLKAGRK